MAESKATVNKRNSNVVEETSTTQNIQDFDAQAQVREQMQIMMRQSNQNAVKIGATCANKDIDRGSEIKDKNTGEVKTDPHTGEVIRYKDKYKILLTFDGGEIETEVTEDQFNMLEMGARYSCTGRLQPVKVWGQTQIMPVFYSFTRLY